MISAKDCAKHVVSQVPAFELRFPTLYTFPPLYTQKPAARRVFVFVGAFLFFTRGTLQSSADPRS